MTAAPLISVIIPAYNVREYLPTTLKNVIVDQFANMPADEWELIVVDDGSTDGSHLEVEPWIGRYPESVKLIRKPNGGVSAARNDGLAAARGRYVYFMDSDDLLTKNALPQLLTIAVQNNADIVHFDFRNIPEANYQYFHSQLPSSPIVREVSLRKVDSKQFLSDTKCLTIPNRSWSVWQHILRREFLSSNDIAFPIGIAIGEDAIFCIKAMMSCQTIIDINEKLYLYTIREDSAIRSELKKNITAEKFEEILYGRVLYLHALRDLRSILTKDHYSNSVVEGIDDEMLHIFYDYMLRLLLNDTPDQKAMDNNRLTFSTRIYPKNYIRVSDMIAQGNFAEDSIKIFEAEMLPTFYAAFGDTIANGAHLMDIYRMLREYKKWGGHIKFGKPRFRVPVSSKLNCLRRWIAAYPLALMMKL